VNEQHAQPQAQIPAWALLLVAVVAIVLATAALTATLLGRQQNLTVTGSMMAGAPGIGMMGRNGPLAANGAQPGDAGFVAGTQAAPRVIRVIAGPGYTFSPASITVARGETVTFIVTTTGPLVHEFMVGPAAAVDADQAGTPEVADIAMMQSRSLTYTFDGTGPYAYACHAEGHDEAGMRGTITVDG
jgi:plastocyanin